MRMYIASGKCERNWAVSDRCARGRCSLHGSSLRRGDDGGEKSSVKSAIAKPTTETAKLRRSGMDSSQFNRQAQGSCRSYGAWISLWIGRYYKHGAPNGAWALSPVEDAYKVQQGRTHPVVFYHTHLAEDSHFPCTPSPFCFSAARRQSGMQEHQTNLRRAGEKQKGGYCSHIVPINRSPLTGFENSKATEGGIESRRFLAADALRFVQQLAPISARNSNNMAVAPLPGCGRRCGPVSGGRFAKSPKRPPATFYQPSGLGTPELIVETGARFDDWSFKGEQPMTT
jgi:hypothetical protein